MHCLRCTFLQCMQNFLFEDIDIKIILHLETQNIMRMWLYRHKSHAKQYVVRHRYSTCCPPMPIKTICIETFRYLLNFYVGLHHYQFYQWSVILPLNRVVMTIILLLTSDQLIQVQYFFWKYFAFNTVSCDSFSWFRQKLTLEWYCDIVIYCYRWHCGFTKDYLISRFILIFTAQVSHKKHKMNHNQLLYKCGYRYKILWRFYRIVLYMEPQQKRIVTGKIVIWNEYLWWSILQI